MKRMVALDASSRTQQAAALRLLRYHAAVAESLNPQPSTRVLDRGAASSDQRNLSCDTLVALPAATRHGETLFAKNSDRPSSECQPLVQRVRREYAPGAVVRTQFLQLPETVEAYRHVGSMPHWCWGYEHGFNEHQVVIGNEGLRSKLEFVESKLLGMDLVRIGLERGSTAAEALNVMTDAITRYGQGIFKAAPREGCYDNGFIVADPHEAYVLETAGHHWAVRRVERTAGISNVYSLEADWDSISADAEAAAEAAGWWSPSSERFNFAQAFGQPPNTTLGSGMHRRRRSCALLSANDGGVDVAAMMAFLSDHSDGAQHGEPLQTELRRGGICVHAEDPTGQTGYNTAASLVADLCSDGGRLPVYWCSLYSPCLGVFLPVFVEGDLPPALSVGRAEPSVDSPWWLFHRLSRAARARPGRVDEIRGQWATLQEQFVETAYSAARSARGLIDCGKPESAAELLTRYMDECSSDALDRVRAMLNAYD